MIGLNEYFANPVFAPYDGSNYPDEEAPKYRIAILDTGVIRNHPVFGDDLVAPFGSGDRIVYQEDFINGTAENPDYNVEDEGIQGQHDSYGHGTQVAGIAASVAPGAELVILKIFRGDSLNQSLEHSAKLRALDWLLENHDDYNIVAVNLSWGDGENYQTDQTKLMHDDENGYAFHYSDQLGQLRDQGVAIVAATGNETWLFRDGTGKTTPGVGYPAADPAAIAVGATWDANVGRKDLGGTVGETTDVDRVMSVAQRHETMLDLFAPGGDLLEPLNDLRYPQGTSFAAAHVAGAVVLAQHLSDQFLGRRLEKEELVALFKETGKEVFDGDQEKFNTIFTPTERFYRRLDVEAMAWKLLQQGTLDVKNTSDWGFSEVDNRTAQTTPTVTGTAPAGSYVWIYVDGATTPGNSFQLDPGDNTFEHTLATPLAVGPHNLLIKVGANSGVPEGSRVQASPALPITIFTSDTLTDTADSMRIRLSETSLLAGQTTSFHEDPAPAMEINWATTPITLTKTSASTIIFEQEDAEMGITLNRGQAVHFEVDGGDTTFEIDTGISGIPGGTTRVANWTLNVDAGVTFNTTHNLHTLNIEDSGLVTVAPDGNRVLVVNSFSVATGGKLDLTNNDMIIHAPTGTSDDVFDDPDHTNDIYGALVRGWAGNMMNGDGITSSTAQANPNLDTYLGYAKNSIWEFASFSGHTVTSHSILIKYTYIGDIDLLGQVDANDLTVFANNFGMLVNAYWSHGDFDFDGDVDAEDLTVFANNFGKGIDNPL